jgi:hypothetical protein
MQTLKELAMNAPDTDDPNYVQSQPTSGTVRGPSGYSNITTDPDDFERGHRAQQVLGVLQRLADVMGGIRGQAEGDPDVQRRHRLSDLRHLRIAGRHRGHHGHAQRHRRGRPRQREFLRRRSPRPRRTHERSDRAQLRHHRSEPRFDARGLLADMYLSQDSLRTLAYETGGYAAVNSNNIDNSLNRIVRANSTYYVLGYYPGGCHKRRTVSQDRSTRDSARAACVGSKGICVAAPVVRLGARRAGSDSRARPRAIGHAQTSDELRQVLNQPLQRNGLTLAVQAAPFKGAPRQASVAIALELDASRLYFTEQPNKTFADGIEVSMFALDERGKPHGGNFYQFNLTLRPDTYQRVRESIVRMNPRIVLPPGRYQLRVGVRESGAGGNGNGLLRPAGARLLGERARHERAASDLGHRAVPVHASARRPAAPGFAAGTSHEPARVRAR